jgi:hypothetical protein
MWYKSTLEKILATFEFVKNHDRRLAWWLANSNFGNSYKEGSKTTFSQSPTNILSLDVGANFPLLLWCGKLFTTRNKGVMQHYQATLVA